MRLAALGLALAALLPVGCVTVRWEREHRNDRLSPAQMVAVVPGESDLTHALEVLGPPLYVWELPRGAFALAYGWTRQRDLGATVMLPTSRGWSPSYTYSSLDANLYGLVLLFDREARLELVREGHLREIGPALQRKRPTDVEDLDEG